MTRAAIVLAIVASSAYADELAMKDLHALAAQNSWRELLATAHKVKPSARDADWRKLVESAAVHVVAAAADNSSALAGARDLVDVVLEAEARYSFLREARPYLDAKAKGVQRVATTCDAGDEDACARLVVALSAGIETFPKGIARQLAVLVDREVGSGEALHFWRLAIAEDRAACEDGRVERALIAVLASNASGAPLDEALGAARTCMAKVESALTQALVDAEPGSAFARNACPLLKSRPGAGVAKKKKCP